MLDMAISELDEAKEEEKRLQTLLLKSLLPKDEADERDCILEVRAGTGGEEASLFAMDIFRMYERYSQKKGWKFEIVDITESDMKGYKEASAAICGASVYGKLKFESGIHRVQRIPITEKSGRIHTSAISVAILPQADEVDVQLRNEDLRIDTYRSGGSGAQHANTTNRSGLWEHVLQDYIAWPMNKINTQPSSQASPKASSPKSISCIVANSSSNGKKICKLLDCENSGEIVAEGILMSADPEDTVHCNPLGPNASKVWVKIKKIGTAKVWRPSPEVECIADALGTTVAWPSDKIVF